MILTLLRIKTQTDGGRTLRSGIVCHVQYINVNAWFNVQARALCVRHLPTRTLRCLRIQLKHLTNVSYLYFIGKANHLKKKKTAIDYTENYSNNKEHCNSGKYKWLLSEEFQFG